MTLSTVVSSPISGSCLMFPGRISSITAAADEGGPIVNDRVGEYKPLEKYRYIYHKP